MKILPYGDSFLLSCRSVCNMATEKNLIKDFYNLEFSFEKNPRTPWSDCILREISNVLDIVLNNVTQKLTHQCPKCYQRCTQPCTHKCFQHCTKKVYSTTSNDVNLQSIRTEEMWRLWMYCTFFQSIRCPTVVISYIWATIIVLLFHVHSFQRRSL